MKIIGYARTTNNLHGDSFLAMIFCL